jgi:NADH dehydrogenase FAD-containing subunit
VKIISPRNHFLFTPLLPSTAVGTLEFRAIQEPVRKVSNTHYYQAKVNNINFENGIIHCKDSFEKAHEFDVLYDALILAPGSETNTFGVKGVVDDDNHVYFLKQLSHSRKIRDRVIECFERASSPGVLNNKEKEQLLTFVIVGGGPTSIEFTSELYDFIKKDVSICYPELLQYIKVIVVEASHYILGNFHSSLISYTQSLFNERKIDILTDIAVKEINNDIALLSNGDQLPFGLMIWGTGVKMVPLVEKLGTPTKKNNNINENIGKFNNGRIKIDSKLRILDKNGIKLESIDNNNKIPAVFVLGDCSGNIDKPLPMLAQVASQQAIYLTKQLNNHGITKTWNSMDDKVIPPFSYTHLGSMASVGSWKGILDTSHIGTDNQDINGPKVSGFLAFVLWRAAYWTKQVSITNKILILM